MERGRGGFCLCRMAMMRAERGKLTVIPNSDAVETPETWTFAQR